MPQIHFVFGVIPVPVFITDDMPDWVGGYAKSAAVFIRPKYIAEGDTGILNHELRHVRQFWQMILLSLAIAGVIYLTGSSLWQLMPALGIAAHMSLYRFVPRYRLWSEVDAYKQQIKAYSLSGPSDWMLDDLQNKYDLTYTRDFIKSRF